jgi:hypothetical protein
VTIQHYTQTDAASTPETAVQTDYFIAKGSGIGVHTSGKDLAQHPYVVTLK